MTLHKYRIVTRGGLYLDKIYMVEVQVGGDINEGWIHYKDTFSSVEDAKKFIDEKIQEDEWAEAEKRAREAFKENNPPIYYP